MPLLLEEEAHHVILLLTHDRLDDDLVDEVGNLIVSNKIKRLVIHVISPTGRPKYLGKLVTLISSIMTCTFTVRYGGSTYADALNLLKSHERDSVTVLMSGDDSTFEEVLQKLNVNYRVLG